MGTNSSKRRRKFGGLPKEVAEIVLLFIPQAKVRTDTNCGSAFRMLNPLRIFTFWQLRFVCKAWFDVVQRHAHDLCLNLAILEDPDRSNQRSALMVSELSLENASVCIRPPLKRKMSLENVMNSTMAKSYLASKIYKIKVRLKRTYEQREDQTKLLSIPLHLSEIIATLSFVRARTVLKFAVDLYNFADSEVPSSIKGTGYFENKSESFCRISSRLVIEGISLCCPPLNNPETRGFYKHFCLQLCDLIKSSGNQLTSLSLDKVKWPFDSETSSLVLPKVTELHASCCLHFTCSSLWISSNDWIGYAAAAFPNLKTLPLWHCTYDSETYAGFDLDALAKFHNLETLKIRNYYFAEVVGSYANRLKHLELITRPCSWSFSDCLVGKCSGLETFKLSLTLRLNEKMSEVHENVLKLKRSLLTSRKTLKYLDLELLLNQDYQPGQTQIVTRLDLKAVAVCFAAIGDAMPLLTEFLLNLSSGSLVLNTSAKRLFSNCSSNATAES